jgi:hypothetical protein
MAPATLWSMPVASQYREIVSYALTYNRERQPRAPCPACRTPDLCAYDGCRRQPGTAVGFAHAPLRPILLPGLQGISGQSRPSPFSRLLKRWTYGPEADPGPIPAPSMSRSKPIMNAAADPPPSPALDAARPAAPPGAGGEAHHPDSQERRRGADLWGRALRRGHRRRRLSEAVRAWYDGA